MYYYSYNTKIKKNNNSGQPYGQKMFLHVVKK